MEFMIVSGLSGAGKGRVKSILADAGYYAADNMPPALWDAFAAHLAEEEKQCTRAAVVTDVRSGVSFEPMFAAMDKLKDRGCLCKLLFVEAEDAYIQRRYQETRRRHPLQDSGMSLADAQNHERVLLAPVRASADYIVDATGLSAAQLRKKMETLLGWETKQEALPIIVSTFGYKNGLPADADLVFDVRFLPNPFYIAELRHLSGLDAPVRDYVLRFPESTAFLERLYGLLTFLLPLFRAEGKTGLTIAIGCTGGRHRSVTLACELHRLLEKDGHPVTIIHRDVNQEG